MANFMLPVARKPAKVETVEENEPKKTATKAGRRKTVAGAALLATDKVRILECPHMNLY